LYLKEYINDSRSHEYQTRMLITVFIRAYPEPD